MLRRTIAATILIVLTMLLAPCAPTANAQAARSAQHECCAPTLTASPADCCSTATPHPATAPSSSNDRALEAMTATSAVIPGLLTQRTAAPDTYQHHQPSSRRPTTILRT